MIYKLDHIARVLKKDSQDVPFDKVEFCEKSLENTRGKYRFLNNKELTDADVYYTKGTPDIEYIAYDNLLNSSPLLYADGTFYGKYSDEKAYEELSELGFKVEKKEEDILVATFKSFLDKTQFKMELGFEKDAVVVSLDSAGWNCPCFLVDSVNRMSEKLDLNNYETDGPDQLMVNGKLLDMIFIRPKHVNVVMEFISVSAKR